eukprot:1348456-Ditylum_brightwellii.AAC.1
MIRDFIRGRRINRQRVTAVQVSHHLIEQGVLQVDKEALGQYEKKGLQAAVRCVQRFVKKI